LKIRKVVKIENPETGGDVTRKWKLAGENGDEKTSAYYLSSNWGKEIRFIDIAKNAGRDELLKLLADADILILNFKAADAEKFKIDYDSLSPLFPRLIYGHITGYGETDARPAFDLVMQAETGFMSMNGTAESGPLKMPVALIDLMTAHQLKEGILVALLQRAKSGKGCCVHVSLFDSAIASLANQASNFLVGEYIAQTEGSLHPNIAPYGETFSCSDNRYVVLAVGNDPQFSRLCAALGLQEMAADPRFANNQSRVIHRKALYEFLLPHFTRYASTEIAALLEKSGVPFAKVKNVGEILSDPASKRLILDEKCVKTAVFSIRE
jgi:crotonobetainyl-CoA:carnitine CoA-transferase CaiB-like acyl-CoA transferase